MSSLSCYSVSEDKVCWALSVVIPLENDDKMISVENLEQYTKITFHVPTQEVKILFQLIINTYCIFFTEARHCECFNWRCSCSFREPLEDCSCVYLSFHVAVDTV